MPVPGRVSAGDRFGSSERGGLKSEMLASTQFSNILQRCQELQTLQIEQLAAGQREVAMKAAQDCAAAVTAEGS